eukprot:2173196-Amphidinium_carterae.2
MSMDSIVSCGKRSKLQSVNGKNNSVSGTLPHDISRMHALLSLMFSFNKLAGPLPEQGTREEEETHPLALWFKSQKCCGAQSS